MKLQLKTGVDPSAQRHLEKQDEVSIAREVDLSSRFSISNDGVLTIKLGKRIFAVPPNDVSELRRFLNSTVDVQPTRGE